MKRPTMTFALTMMILAGPAYAQHVTMKEEKPGLLQIVKITVDAATATAQAKVPKGKIGSAEIEEEKGKLISSFDVKTEGKGGIDEVDVDAISGKVLSVQHESPKDEATEREADRKKL